MKKIFCIFYLCVFCMQGYAAESKEEQIKKIDQQIEILEQEKIGLEGRVTFYESEANRLQFQNSNLSVAKKYWELAKVNKTLIQEVDKKIDALQQQKKDLLNVS